MPTPRIAVVYSNEQPLEDPGEDLGVHCALELNRAGALTLLSLPAEAGDFASTHQLRNRLGSRLRLRTRHPRNPVWRKRYRLHREDIFHEDLRIERPDMVLIVQGDAFDGHHCADWCLRAGIPYALVCGATGEFLWQTDDRLDRTRRVTLGARRTWIPCAQTRAEMELQVGLPIPHAAMLPVSTPTLRAHPLPWPPAPARIAFIGASAVPGDGMDLLLHILARPEWRARAVACTLFTRAGMVQWARDALAWLELLKVEIRTEWASTAEIWEDHHLGVFPRRRSGIDGAIVAALHAGRPVVTTPAGGNPGLVREGQNGFLAAAWTEHHFAEAMERAWAARETWQALGRTASRMPVQDRAHAAAALSRELQLLALEPAGARP